MRLANSRPSFVLPTAVGPVIVITFGLPGGAACQLQLLLVLKQLVCCVVKPALGWPLWLLGFMNLLLDADRRFERLGEEQSIRDSINCSRI